MARWSEFEAEAPELAQAALARLRAHKHLTIATLRKDFALHSGSDDPPDWSGDAKIAGHATASVAETKELGRYHLFRCDIEEVSVVRRDETLNRLVIEMWHEGRGSSRLER